MKIRPIAFILWPCFQPNRRISDHSMEIQPQIFILWPERIKAPQKGSLFSYPEPGGYPSGRYSNNYFLHWSISFLYLKLRYS